ncbi:S8 family serine peptidase [Rhodovulum sp. DZ06]|uniref:S8 family serine peptidase n=1 Tax=Rhodovulum sp. DZ06 TaxID=3425126 RepID=UPI003D34E4BA
MQIDPRRPAAAPPFAALALSLGLAACAAPPPPPDFELNPPPQAVIRAGAAQVVDAREMVVLLPGAAAAARLRAGAAPGGFALRGQEELPGLSLVMQRYTFPAPLTGAEAIAALERIEPSATAGVNHAYRPAAGAAGAAGDAAAAQDAADPLDYANGMLGWAGGACAAAGPIGMLDAAVTPDLPELRGVRVISAAFHRGPAADIPHGDQVAAVLTDPRRLSGVTLYAAAVIGVSARGEAEAGVDDVLRGLDWMTAQGVRLVNVSLAGPYNKLLDRGVDVARARGVTLVAAVGNDGAAADPRYPAALGNVVAATAVDAGGAIWDRAVRGDYVDVAAPGVDVKVRVGGREGFATGTSIAVPFVAARIASDRGLYGAAPAAVRAALGAEARDLGAPGPDPDYGAGLLRAPRGCGG